MKNLLKPNYYVNSIYNINYQKLKGMGIKNIIFDIDNTLVKWKTPKIDEKGKVLLEKLLEMGFNICILSNSSAKRVKNFTDNSNILYFGGIGFKPMKNKFNGAMRILKAKKEETCIIGDQIFTDILGGNRIGITTILVEPIDSNELFTTKFVRKIEKKIKKKLSIDNDICSY